MNGHLAAHTSKANASWISTGSRFSKELRCGPTAAMVSTMRLHCLSLLIFGILCQVGQSQMVGIKTVNGKTVACMHTGLSSDLEDCGAKSYWYKYVFVGQIAKITPANDDEKELEIVPQEIFSGMLPTRLTVVTSQGLCLEPMAVGDRWLFYLRSVPGKPILLDHYGNDSKPVAQARDEIATLQRLRTIGDAGLLRGQVLSGERFNGTAIEGATVIATNKTSGQQAATVSGPNGRYEFPPLLPGPYRITVGQTAGRHPNDSGIDLESGGCWDLSLTHGPDGSIHGRIHYADGKPANHIDVVLITKDRTWYVTTQTNEKGFYRFDGAVKGDYVIGVNFPPSPGWFNGAGGGTASGLTLPSAALFYPNSPNFAGAETIRLQDDENRDRIDFVLPLR
jgi:hypothetical protein